jgi:hypothetical protein
MFHNLFERNPDSSPVARCGQIEPEPGFVQSETTEYLGTDEQHGGILVDSSIQRQTESEPADSSVDYCC